MNNYNKNTKGTSISINIGYFDNSMEFEENFDVK
jgi:hypothetical protein